MIYLQNPHILTIVEDMRKREYLGQMELMVLLAAIRPASDAYGVQICREISEKSGREVALASVEDPFHTPPPEAIERTRGEVVEEFEGERVRVVEVPGNGGVVLGRDAPE